MSNFKIIADSSCDISSSLAEFNQISIVPFQISFDSTVYYKENIEISIKDFYHKLRNENVFPKTSLPSIQLYSEEFKKHLDKGLDILCISLTSKFSGSYQAAVNAASILLEDYPERKIIVIDSMNATASQGALTLKAAQMRDIGLTLEETVKILEELKFKTKIYVTLDSLEYLQKGGRLGKASALAGSLLNIKPIIIVSDGELLPQSKVRGRKKALSELVTLINKDIFHNKDEYTVYLLHADEYEDCIFLKEVLENDYGYKISLPIFDVGITIGAHIGPTAIGIGYIPKVMGM